MRQSKVFSLLSILIGLLTLLSQPLAHAKETDQDMSLAPVGGAAMVDPFTGSLNTSIPIDVPPGRHGMQPNLALTYWSSGGNGWVGMGWKLEMGAIERQTRFGLNYNGDEYTFRMSGNSGDLVNIGSGEYRAKIEGGFSRIRKLTANDGKPYWEITEKSGTRYLFGQTAASRMADPTDGNKIFKWCLDRVEDTNGNYMTVTYWGDQGQLYLDHIDYTGNTITGALPTNTVKFYSEGRSDAPDMYTTNYRIKTAYRVRTVDVLANGQRVRSYKLSYTMAQSNNRSLLSNVQQYGKDAILNGSGSVTGGTAVPQLVMAYTDQTSGNYNPTVYTSSLDINTQLAGNLQPIDINGDGKTDYVHITGNPGQVITWLSNGDGSYNLVVYTSNWDTCLSNCGTWQFGDVSGDGKVDLIHITGQPGQVITWLSNGNGSYNLVVYTSSLDTCLISCGMWMTGDVNGDGNIDFIHNTGNPGQMISWISLGNGGYNTTVYTSNWDICTMGCGIWQFGDVSGDGKVDLIHITGQPGQVITWLSNGNGSYNLVVYTSGLDTCLTSCGMWMTGDVNGDGNIDFIHNTGNPGQMISWISLGNGGYNTTVYTSNWDICTMGCGIWQFGDVSGDGKVDLIHITGNSGQAITWISNGDATFTITPYTSTLDVCTTACGTWRIGDFNGDGKIDLGHVTGNPGQVITWFAQGTAGNLLTSFSNGIGNILTLAYTPSTQYANIQMPFSVQTGSAITTNDGNGTSTTTNYTYSGGFYHIAERDFRGFNYAKVTGPAGPNGEQAISETWFHQGNDTAIDVNNPNVPTGYLNGKPYRTRVSNGAGQIFTETTTTYAADPDGVVPFFTPPQQIDTSICDGTSCGKQTRVVYSYDSYGNVTETDQYGDLSDSSDDRTMIRTYAINPASWIMSLPATETIYQGLGSAGTQIAQTTFYYDGATSCSVASTNQTPTQGLLTRVVRWLSGGTNPETRTAYDTYGNVLCSRDPNGNTTTLTYDSSATFPKTATNALGHVVTTQYYGVDGIAMDTGLYGQVKRMTDANGQTSTTTYDVLGRLTQSTLPDGSTKTVTYNNWGTVGTQNVQQVSSVGLTTTTYFDGLGRTILMKGTGPEGKTVATQTQYNARGMVLKRSMPYFDGLETPSWTMMAYDPVGRITQVTNPDSSRGLSCTSQWVTVTIDANNHRKRETRDAAGRLVKVEEYLGTFTTCDTSVGTPYATTIYQYDGLGNIRFVTDAKGNVTEMRYDTLSRKTYQRDPDLGAWTYTYDAAGNLIQQADAKQQVLSGQYDALNRRRQKDYGPPKLLGSGDVIYTYDGATSNGFGRLTRRQDASGTVALFYDTRGRLTRTDRTLSGATYTTQRSYDGLGRLTTVTYPDNTSVNYAYTGPLLQRVYDSGMTYGTYAGYTAFGQPGTLTASTPAASVVTTWTYATTNSGTCQLFRLCTLQTVNGATTHQAFTYSYDLAGNITQIADPITGNQSLAYDDLNRLTTATGPYGNVTYSYNELGNLLSNSLVGAYTYPASGATSVRPHAVSTAGNNSYAYDANGNLISGANRTVSYDPENRPVTLTQGSTTEMVIYDGDGGRVQKTVNGITTLYINQYYECAGATPPYTCVKYVWAGGQRLTMKQVGTGVMDYYQTDHLGSTRVMTTSSGTQEERITYTPFGATQSDTGIVDVPYKYTGQELDATSLYFYGSRYYDPVLGRFLSADTIVPNVRDPQALNRYSYVRNNPLLYIDPTGHKFGINLRKFTSHAFGKTGSLIVGIAIQAFTGGIIGPVGAFVAGGAVLAQSPTGRYILGGEIVALAVASTFICPGCNGGWAVTSSIEMLADEAAIQGALSAAAAQAATASAIYTGAAIGAVSGAALGGYSAAAHGGDISKGVLFGAGVGAVTGAIAGGITGGNGSFFDLVKQVDPVGGSRWLLTQPLAGMVSNAGSGLINGYQGGTGSHVWRDTWHDAVSGIVTTPLGTAAWDTFAGLLPSVPGGGGYALDAQGNSVPEGPNAFQSIQALDQRLAGGLSKAGAIFGNSFIGTASEIVPMPW